MLSEGDIRIPAVARWPGRIPAATTIDLYATFQEWAAIELPSNQPCDGVSLSRLFRDPQA